MDTYVKIFLLRLAALLLLTPLLGYVSIGEVGNILSVAVSSDGSRVVLGGQGLSSLVAYISGVATSGALYDFNRISPIYEAERAAASAALSAAGL